MLRKKLNHLWNSQMVNHHLQSQGILIKHHYKNLWDKVSNWILQNKNNKVGKLRLKVKFNKRKVKNLLYLNNNRLLSNIKDRNLHLKSQKTYQNLLCNQLLNLKFHLSRSKKSLSKNPNLSKILKKINKKENNNSSNRWISNSNKRMNNNSKKWN